jgi:serine/threonine protein phosphatase 1
MNARRIIAIGDIHGCLSHLEQLFDILQPASADHLIFLGDYIDRGPDIPGTIAYLRSLKYHFPLSIFLRGNHEAMLLDLLLVPHGKYATAYLNHSNGGYITLRQYGAPAADVEAFKNKKMTLNDARELCAAYIPESDIEFLRCTKLYHIYREYLFVHAGIDPAKSLSDQNDDDFMCIRTPFLSHSHSLDYTIIYGHTPTRERNYIPRIELNEKRIGIDTGAVYGGYLCAVTLPDLSFAFYPLREDVSAIQ